MSGDAGAGGGAATGAPSGSPAGSPATNAPAQPTSAQVHAKAVNDLNDRTAQRRVDAERATGYGTNAPQRGSDGKFQKGAEAPADSSGTDAKNKPGLRATSQEKPEAKAAAVVPEEISKLKDEHAKAVKAAADRASAAEAKNEEWEATAERVVARLDAYQARVEYLEQALAAAGGSVDPQHAEMLSLKEQLQARNLQDERIAAQRAAQAEAAQKAEAEKARAASMGEFRNALAQVGTKFPELKPAMVNGVPNFQANPEAGMFWKGVKDAIDAGATLPALVPYLATAGAVAAGIKAKRGTPKIQAPRILSGANNVSSGEVRSIDRRDVVDKWKSRHRAG